MAQILLDKDFPLTEYSNWLDSLVGQNTSDQEDSICYIIVPKEYLEEELLAEKGPFLEKRFIKFYVEGESSSLLVGLAETISRKQLMETIEILKNLKHPIT